MKLAVVAALEALEVGDVVLAIEILLGALDDYPRPVGVHCPDCHRRFDWPGLLDEHRQRAHHKPVRRAVRPTPGKRWGR